MLAKLKQLKKINWHSKTQYLKYIIDFLSNYGFYIILLEIT